MKYITVFNLSINTNYRILVAELNYRFTETSDVVIMSGEMSQNTPLILYEVNIS